MSAGPDIQDGLAFSRELAQRVQDEADHATWWWFWYAAALVFVVAIAASAVWPLGVAA